MFKWFTVVSGILLVLYIYYIIMSGIAYKLNYDKTHFPCTYIKGMCTVKPTWKNCSGRLHGVPYRYCERKLNRL